VITQSFDVANRAAVKGFLDSTKSTFGHLNGIANIPGVKGREMGTHELHQLSDQEYDHVIDTNIRGVFNMVREALGPGFLEPASSIVNVSSLYGIKGAPLSSLYCASKSAVIGFTKAAAIEVGPRNIRINAICP
jgi:NAD(P)-dependent dehydrogenase (short-subunit alcohol dehydrogenase family)